METGRKEGRRLARRNRMGLLNGRLILLVLETYCYAMTYSQPRQDYFIHAETLQPITYLIPTAQSKFTIAPLLKVPPASRGEPRGARGFGSPCLQGEP